MKFDTREPCSSCPYRRDAPLAFWDHEHFMTLVANDEDKIGGAVYGCHGTRKLLEPSVCAGWLFDQIRRGLPSIQLRITLARVGERDRPGDIKDLDEVTSGGHALYDSIAEMVAANEAAYLRQALRKRRKKS